MGKSARTPEKDDRYMKPVKSASRRSFVRTLSGNKSIATYGHRRRRLWVITRLLFLLILANGTPLLASKIFGNRFSRPLDGGAKCPDGQPLFGASKTIRGIFLSVLVTAVGACLVDLGCKIGALVGSVAMSGDLFSSFLKRRWRLPASSRAVGLDQIPESLLPLLACRRALLLTLSDIAVAVLAFFLGDILISRLLYKFRVRDRPY